MGGLRVDSFFFFFFFFPGGGGAFWVCVFLGLWVQRVERFGVFGFRVSSLELCAQTRFRGDGGLRPYESL